MWPFTKKSEDKPRPKQGSRDAIEKVGSRMVRVSSIGFLGPYLESNNRKYIVAWSDSDRSRGVGGSRESGRGTYILGENGHLVVQGRLERPNDGKVADTGVFIINDWLFGDGLRSVFHAFNNLGEQLISHNFKAHLLNNGISSDGRFAVCQCANSDTDDSGVLAFFDLGSDILLWKAPPVSGWADSYEFDSTKRRLALQYRDKGSYHYSYDGEFLEQERWEKERVIHASPFELSYLAKEQLKSAGSDLDAVKAQEILDLLNSALGKETDKYPNEKAAIYRMIGAVYEHMGQLAKTVEYFEMALQLNPKIGVKKKLAALKKIKT